MIYSAAKLRQHVAAGVSLRMESQQNRLSRGGSKLMGTFTKLTYHIVFGTKYRRNTIRPAFVERLYEYVGGIIRADGGHMIEIGGVEDHVHILANLPASGSVSDSVRDIKANSSRWINELTEVIDRFEWQKGYAAFTVSYSQIDGLREYIQNQVEHHRSRSFEEEYILFLQRHNIPFERQWLFEDEHHG